MTAAEFEDVYRRCAPLVHARARRMLGADADDVVQDVFSRLWRRPPAHGELLPWLYRTSTNACLDRLRAQRRRDPAWERKAEVAHEPGRAMSVVEELSSKELCRRLIVRADDATQHVVALVYFDDASHDDAAAILGISRKTVGERLERFHQLARKVIQRWQT